MKLHLPHSLRNAVLACLSAVAGLSTTVASGALLGGACTMVLAVAPQAAAEEPAEEPVTQTVYTWNGTADKHIWDTDENNTIWSLNGSLSGFVDGSDAKFDSTAQYKTVTIKSDISAGTITIADDYNFDVDGGLIAEDYKVPQEYYLTGTITGTGSLTFSGVSNGPTKEERI